MPALQKATPSQLSVLHNSKYLADLATTQAVVISSVFIIIVDFLVSRLMIGIFGS